MTDPAASEGPVVQGPIIQGPVVQGPIIQGWCPGALRPMLSGDGWVVRIRPRDGRLSREQAAGIADLAALHGNGLIDLSARANIQLRGVTEASHAPLIDGLRALGLIDPTPAAEAARNIIVTPFWDEGDGTQTLAADLAAALARHGAPILPGKFGHAIDCGTVPVLRATSADIRVERGARGGLIVVADGMDTGATATKATVVRVVMALARWFADHGVTDGRGRMARLIASGAQPPEMFLEAPRQSLTVTPEPFPGRVAQGVLVGFEFGQMQAQTLAALAALGPLRATPWRMLLVEGVPGVDLPGLITKADDPMLRVTACTGAPGCLQAVAPTRTLARALAPLVPVSLHVSGCAKGCAHPAPAPLTLTATATGFSLIRGGTAADPGQPVTEADLPALLTGTP